MHIIWIIMLITLYSILYVRGLQYKKYKMKAWGVFVQGVFCFKGCFVSKRIAQNFAGY